MVNTLKPRWTVSLPQAVEREMDEMLQQFFRDDSPRGSESPSGNVAAGWYAPASLWEEEGQWCVEVDLPGVAQEDIDVTLEKNRLCITADRRPA